MEEYIADYEYKESISSVSEGSSVSARIGGDLIINSYEKIVIWNIETLSVVDSIIYTKESPVSAIGCTEDEDPAIIVGHENGNVRFLNRAGDELFGLREHVKKIIGICANSDVSVIYTTSAFTVVDMHTEQVISTISVDLQITSMKIHKDALIMGSMQGIVHVYRIEDVIKGIVEAEMMPLAGRQILDFITREEIVYAVMPESIVDLRTKKEISVNHRISKISTLNEKAFTRDTKGKYHWMQVKDGKIEEVAQFKNSRPVASVQVYGDKAVSIFADNGISVHRSKDFSVSVEGGRENLIGIVENKRTLLGITETEGKIFATCSGTDCIQTNQISMVLFEDTSMACISVNSGNYYIGKKDGTVSVRNFEGEETESIRVSESSVVSIDAKDSVIAVGTECKVVLIEGNERDEIEYEEEVVCVKLSEDGSIVMAGLTDSTVKIHKIDGTKILSLYGHSVPVVDICYSGESGLIYTLGGDKLIKVWGISHGDCRRTINPIDPSGIALNKNLLIVSTGYGLIYYLKDTFEKVKKIEYQTGKKRAVPGQNRIAMVDCYLVVIRERIASLFMEGEYGTSLIEQKVLEEKAQETEEIAKEKKIYKISAVEELEDAIEKNDSEKAYESIKVLSQNDIEKTIDIMNAETQKRFLNILLKLSCEKCNPLILAWALGYLSKKNPNSTDISAPMDKIRIDLRKQAREAMANRAAILWSIEE